MTLEGVLCYVNSNEFSVYWNAAVFLSIVSVSTFFRLIISVKKILHLQMQISQTGIC
mgnify:CR=1 FL=1